MKFFENDYPHPLHVMPNYPDLERKAMTELFCLVFSLVQTLSETQLFVERLLPVSVLCIKGDVAFLWR